MHIPRLAREAGLARGNDIDRSRGSRQGIVKRPRPTAPPDRGELVGEDPLGGWHTARRWPRTPDRGSTPVNRHSRLAVAEDSHTPDRGWGQPRRRTREHAPAAGIGSLRRAAAQHPSSPPRTRRSGAAPPTEEAAAWLPAAYPCTGRSIPRCRSPPPKWAAPAAHEVLGGPETSSGKRQAHLGHRQGHRTPALLGQEWP